MDYSKTPPKRRKLDNDDQERITTKFTVKNLSKVITSPKKNSHGSSSKWFEFAAVQEDTTKRCVSFFPPLREKLLLANNKATTALKMGNVLSNNATKELKLDAISTIISEEKLDAPFKEAVGKIVKIDDIIFKLELNKVTSLKGTVVNHNVKENSNSTIYTYTINDNSNIIDLISFKQLPIMEKNSYNIHNVKITSFNQNRQVEAMLTTVIERNENFVVKKTIPIVNSKRVTIQSINLLDDLKCIACKGNISTDIIDEDGIYTCPYPTCKKLSAETKKDKGVVVTTLDENNNVEDFLTEEIVVSVGGPKKILKIRTFDIFLHNDTVTKITESKK